MHITNTETFMAQLITVETSVHSTETWARLAPHDWVFMHSTGNVDSVALPTQLEALYRAHLGN